MESARCGESFSQCARRNEALKIVIVGGATGGAAAARSKLLTPRLTADPAAVGTRRALLYGFAGISANSVNDTGSTFRTWLAISSVFGVGSKSFTSWSVAKVQRVIEASNPRAASRSDKAPRDELTIAH